MYENFKRYVADENTIVPIGELDGLLNQYPWFTTARMTRWIQHDLPDADPLVDCHLWAAPVPAAMLRGIDSEEFGLRVKIKAGEPEAQNMVEPLVQEESADEEFEQHAAEAIAVGAVEQMQFDDHDAVLLQTELVVAEEILEHATAPTAIASYIYLR